MQVLLEKLEKYLLYATVFLLPIALLPISPNLFTPGRLAVLTIGVGLLLLVKAIRVVLSGKLEFQVGSLDFPVLLLAASYLLSAVLRTPNKMEAYLLPGTATSVIAGALLYYLINQLGLSQKKTVLTFLLGSGAIYAILLLFAASGALTNIPGLPASLRSPAFTPDGGYLPVAIFLAVLLPLGIGTFVSEKDTLKKVVSLLFSLAALLALAVSIYQMLPGKPYSPRFPGYAVSWNVAVDSLKQSPVLGIGPGNYITAFSRFKPISYNASDLWPVRFATGNNFYLTALTEVGMLGLAALALLIFSIYKSLRREVKEGQAANIKANAAVYSLVLFLVLMAIFPATVLLTVLLFIVLAFFAKTSPTSLNLTSFGATGASSRLPSFIISLPVIVATLVFGFYMGRALAAELSFKQAVDALAQGDGQTTYDKVRGAIRLNPNVDRYHSTFSQINLAIARNLAQKQDLTDAERTTLTQLVQQAINEGKAAVALNLQRAGNWEVLAQTYRAIMPIAEGADAFAIQSYSQAVALDPFNPNLRINLGGIYYGMKNYDDAVKVLELAVTTKPDLANGHYNLAFAYRDQKELEKAIQQMTLVLSLIEDKNSQDYQTAKAALEDFEKQRPTTPEGAETLTPPQGEEVPPLSPPLELPEESQPPEVSPSPTLEVSPTPSE
jgi:tetratricopeptide (TPR) repeat protein